MNFKNSYPWFLYHRIFRVLLFIWTFIFVLLFKILPHDGHKLSDEYLNSIKMPPFLFYLFIFFLLILIQCIALYFLLKPIETMIHHIQSFDFIIPYEKTLKLKTIKNQWAKLDTILHEMKKTLKKNHSDMIEENLKSHAILESIEDSLVAFDIYETLLFYNQKFKSHFICENDKNSLISKTWHFFDSTISQAFKDVCSTGQSITLKSQQFPLGRNPSSFYDLSISPLKNKNESIRGALGVFHDVTTLKHTEMLRTDFIANLSHEMRTPLTSIKGFTQILQAEKEQISAQLHLFLNKIIMNTDRMSSLFNELMDLSIIENGQFDKFQIEPVQKKAPHHHQSFFINKKKMNEILLVIEENLRMNHPEKKIIFIKDIQDSKIFIRERLLEILLMNIFDNAIKYSSVEPRINISVMNKDHHTIIKISDNGDGIESKHIRRIFERFYRVDPSREYQRGTGLGLSIVKQIVLRHKGKIEVESAGKGKGTSFIITLPLFTNKKN